MEDLPSGTSDFNLEATDTIPLLQVKDLKVDFTDRGKSIPALHGISLECNRGEMVAIVGESGSGKSVTALSILQLLPAPPALYTGGNILLQRKEGGPLGRSGRFPSLPVDLLRADASLLRSIRGSEVSMIFQEPMTSLNPVFTCGVQIAEALSLHLGLSRREARKQAIACLEQVLLENPDRIYDRYPHELSGGQKQRVMIAMAISCNPSLLIADEPTTALDVTVQKGILDLLKALQRERNMGLLFITHDLGLVQDTCDRVILLYKGRIVEEGPVAKVFEQPSHPYTKALLACRPYGYPKGVRLPVIADFWREEVGAPHPKVELILTTASAPILSPDPLLTIEDLSVWFPSKATWLSKALPPVKAVDGVSFSISEGEILGLVGESGSGKTTLGRALLKLIPPTSGKIIFRHQNLLALSTREMRAYRRDLQIVFQDPYSALNPRMTLGTAISEVFRVRDPNARSASREKRAKALLEKVGLPRDFFNRYPHECSGGQRQRAVIARALAMDPGFILFDESVSALDVSVQAQILNLIGDLKREFGFTGVFISHDLSVVRYLCDRIMVMNRGRIVEIGPAESVFQNPTAPYTRNLLEAIPGKGPGYGKKP